jgi:hypothetical protein
LAFALLAASGVPLLAGGPDGTIQDVVSPANRQGTVIHDPIPEPTHLTPEAMPRVGPLRRCKLWLQDCFLGYPAEFQPLPLGQAMGNSFATQVANGAAALMVLYDYDFVPGTALLNPRGQDRLARIGASLSQNVFPVVVERVCPPALGEARRLSVLQVLAAGPCPVPPERVVVGLSPAYGLSGVEAEIVYSNLLLQTRGRGLGSLGGAGTGTGNAPQQPPQPPVQP